MYQRQIIMFKLRAYDGQKVKLIIQKNKITNKK